MIIATDSIDLNRRIAGLAKTRRTIKQLADAAKQTALELAYVREQFRGVDAQNGELNAQLAAVPRDVLQNNRLVGLINANNSKLRQLDDQRTALTEKLATDRKKLSDGESQYSDAVTAIRRDLSELQRRLEKSLEEPAVNIAVGVYRTNFQTPESIDIGGLIGPVDRRLKQFEKEIFNESIAMELSEGGAFLVNVTVGESSVPMILDSGASVICLPAETATRLGILIPPGAPQMKLSLADGRSIDARGVVLPKVRVGGFEAENVDAAILAPSAISPEPLLGLSFLGNFRFEIDAPGKSLKLLRVGE
jgi:aspartyl protease family protein